MNSNEEEVFICMPAPPAAAIIEYSPVLYTRLGSAYLFGFPSFWLFLNILLVCLFLLPCLLLLCKQIAQFFVGPQQQQNGG